MTAVDIVLWAILLTVVLGLTVYAGWNARQLEKEMGLFIEAKEARIATLTRQRDALIDDHANPNRDAIYKHDLHALLKDGAKDGCHTDVGTKLRTELGQLRAYVAKLSNAADNVARPPGCQCTWEWGDSPCPVHGQEEET